MNTSSRTRFLILALAAAVLVLPAAGQSRTVAQKKKLALEQYASAERMREALTGRPVAERTRSAYERVIESYRRVYYTSPSSARADESIVAVAELLAEIGNRFHDPKMSEAAVGQYEFLRREYPGSKYRGEALFTIAQIYRDDLHDNEKAREVW